MANIKISDLPSVSAGSDTQQFEVADSGTSKKVSGAQLKAYFKDGFALTDVVGLNDALAARQPLDATLTSLSIFNTNGLVTQTAPDTFTGRTILGTTDQITVSNGNGVAGNPTIAPVVATQAQAEAGTDSLRLMTPLRVSQAISALGKATLLGTLTTTSGTSKTLSGLDFNKYPIVLIAFRGVSYGSAANMTLEGEPLFDANTSSDAVFGFCTLQTVSGTYSCVVSRDGSGGNNLGYSGDTTITSSSTSLTIAHGGGFTAGSIAIFGIA